MKRSIAAIAFVSFLITGCSKEYDCADPQIQTAFTGFAIADIDTFILRKYQPGTNYQSLVDTFSVTFNRSGQFYTSTDTTWVYINQGSKGMRAGFDWQLFIPAKNRTVRIADIASEKKTGSCAKGIFSMSKVGCDCQNKIFSVKKDGQLTSIVSSGPAANTVYIAN